MITRHREADENICPAQELVTAFCLACMSGQPQATMWPSTFRTGELVAGRYRVEKELARGGMGEVYEVTDGADGRRLALKCVLSTHADSPTAIRRLQREASLARRVVNPHVYCVRDVGLDDSNPLDVTHFITMDLVNGISLASLVKERALCLARAELIARQLLLALGATHQAGVLHRDVKSHNVVVAGGGAESHVVLIDFGLARRLERGRTIARSSVLGSLGYMAPEQLSGGGLSPATDIYSFGMVLLEMLAGPLPAELRSRSRLRNTGRMPAVPALPAHVPARLAQIVAQCIQTDPAERFSSAAAVLRALDAGQH